MTLDDLRVRVERYALEQIPTVVGAIQKIATSSSDSKTSADTPAEESEVTLIGIENASPFVQHMQALEGAMRLEMCGKGCICKMELCASVQMTPTGNALVTVATAHDQFCPTLSFWQDEDDKKAA